MTRFTRFTKAVPGAAALAAALIVSGGCATKGDLRTLRVEMQGLAARQDSLLAVLERQSAVTQDTLRRQNDQLFEIRGDVSRQLQLILDELATLRELAGQNQRTIAALRDQVERLSRGGTAAGARPSEAIVGPDQMTGAVAPSGLAEQTYNTAVGLAQRGSLATAEAAFEDFLRDHGSHELAPDAHFYLGDILEMQDKLRDAIAAFEQIPGLFPTHRRVPDALYRIGLLHLQLDDRQEAVRSFERVVNTYPESDAASLAREQLRELR
jgi:tol-pal system protein YbgF